MKFKKLIINNRRALLILVLLFSFINNYISFQMKNLPYIFFIIYTLFTEIYINKKNMEFKYELILNTIDILFITWIIYYFSNDIFYIFFFLIIFSYSYNYGYKRALIITLIILFCFYFISFFLNNTNYLIFNNLLIQFLIKPLGFLLSFYSAGYISSIHKDEKEELEELSKQMKIKNQILSTISHELNTPLALIKTSSEIILEERPGKVNSVQKDFMEIILSNSLRLIKLVQNILIQIKIEHSWLKLKLKSIDIRPVVKKTINSMMPILNQKGQTIRYSYPNLISNALADENWMQQVMINLIHNASKNIDKSGKIVVTIKENEQFLVVSVMDNGCGIENSRKMQIFSEYYQSDNMYNEDIEGMGLGLAIVKHVVEKHNGKIYVGSVPGMGTTFAFTLPKGKKE